MRSISGLSRTAEELEDSGREAGGLGSGGGCGQCHKLSLGRVCGFRSKLKGR